VTTAKATALQGTAFASLLVAACGSQGLNLGTAPDDSGAIGSIGFQCNADTQCDCPPGATCSHTCTRTTLPGCRYTCGAGSTCSDNCPSGGCEQTCSDAASCSMHCPGGRCQETCTSTGTCSIDCPGGDCHLLCFGAQSCSITGCTSGCALFCNGAADCQLSCTITAGGCVKMN
jgi:hypothetical protein